MPNHVHALVQFLGATKLKPQCYSWKKYTATRINRKLGLAGMFWQKESFDHLVRNYEQYLRLRKYIEENPAKARLRAGEYLYYRRPEGSPGSP
ncbi:MAG TPA: transposase [Pirellulales bacterium]|nr:transposase [Pirellulales bacterium]